MRESFEWKFFLIKTFFKANFYPLYVTKDYENNNYYSRKLTSPKHLKLTNKKNIEKTINNKVGMRCKQNFFNENSIRFCEFNLNRTVIARNAFLHLTACIWSCLCEWLTLICIFVSSSQMQIIARTCTVYYFQREVRDGNSWIFNALQLNTQLDRKIVWI